MLGFWLGCGVCELFGIIKIKRADPLYYRFAYFFGAIWWDFDTFLKTPITLKTTKNRDPQGFISACESRSLLTAWVDRDQTQRTVKPHSVKTGATSQALKIARGDMRGDIWFKIQQITGMLKSWKVIQVAVYHCAQSHWTLYWFCLPTSKKLLHEVGHSYTPIAAVLVHWDCYCHIWSSIQGLQYHRSAFAILLDLCSCFSS